MGNKIISFRFNDAEVEALQTLQSPYIEESPSQTAARLLRELLGLSKKSEPSTPASNVNIQELVKQEVEKAIAQSQLSAPAINEDIQDLVKQEVEKAIAPIKQEIKELSSQLIEGMDDEHSLWNTLNNRLTEVISSREEDKQRLAELEERLRDWMLQVTKWLAPEPTSPPAQQKTKKGNQHSPIRI